MPLRPPQVVGSAYPNTLRDTEPGYARAFSPGYYWGPISQEEVGGSWHACGNRANGDVCLSGVNRPLAFFRIWTHDLTYSFEPFLALDVKAGGFADWTTYRMTGNGLTGMKNFGKGGLIDWKVVKDGNAKALQLQFSMVDLENVEVLKWAHDQDLGVMTYGSLGGGILTGRYRTLEKYETMDNRNRFYPYFREPLFSKVMGLLDKMQPLADRRGVTLAQIAINWSRQKPFVDTSIFGAQTRARVESNISCLDWELTEEELRELDKAIEEAMG